MHIHRNSSQSSSQGPDAFFTGRARIDSRFAWGELTRLPAKLLLESGARQGGKPVDWMEKASDAYSLDPLG